MERKKQKKRMKKWEDIDKFQFSYIETTAIFYC